MVGRLILGLLLALAAPEALGQMETADSLFEKGLYQKALEIYEKQAGFRAFFRTQESKGLLQRSAESAQSLFDTPLPTSDIERALHLLLRARTAREYLKKSASFIPKEEERSAQDVTRWTQSEWRSKISEDYFALHSLRKVLVQEPIESVAYFVRAEGTDTELFPSVWDFTAAEWTDFLATEAQRETTPDGDEWIQQSFSSKVVNSLPPHELSAAIWDELASLEGPRRELAREHARWQRVYPKWARGAKSEKAAETLVALFETFRQSRSRALAGTSAAEIFWRAKESEKALALCEKVAQSGPTNGCKEIQESILAPELEIESFPSPSISKTRARVQSRNLGELYFRLYATTEGQLATLQPSSDWTCLRALNLEAASQFLKQKAIHTTSLNPKPHRPHETTHLPLSLPPALPEGFYVLLAAADPSFKTVLRGAVLNVTDLVLFADRPLNKSAGKSALSVRVFSGKSGLPEPEAQITVRAPKSSQTGASSKEGTAEFLLPENLADLLVKKKQSAAVLPQPLWLSFSDSRPLLSMHLDTDRAIYRPGQLVRARLTVFSASGNEYSLAKDPVLSVKASDANGKVFFKKNLKLNRKLSASFQFNVPEGVLLGQFSISAEGKEKGTNTRGSAYRALRVEEYVRPDFELKLQESRSLSLRGPVSVSGTARTYTGSARKDQAILFRIYREDYWPRHFQRGLLPTEPSERKLLSNGTAYTNERGEFSILFPTALGSETKATPHRFIVEVRTTGPSGKTVQNQQTYFAKHVALRARMAKGYFVEGEEARLFIEAFSEGGEPLQTKGTLKIQALEAPEEIPQDFSATDVEHLLSDLTAAKQVVDRPFDTAKGPLSLQGLRAGIYRVSLDAEGALGETSHFIVWSKTLVVQGISKPEKESYSVGQTATVLIGSSTLKGKMVVEVWKGQERLSTELVEGGVRLHSLPILPSHRGGVVLRWFGVYDHFYRQGQAAIDVAWDDRKLVLHVDAPKVTKPGSRALWTFRLKDLKGNLVNADGLLSVYDASLDAYAPPEMPWVDSLYGPNYRSSFGERSYSPASFAWFSRPPAKVFPEEVRFPSRPKLRIETETFSRHYSLGGASPGRFAPMAMAMETKSAPTAAAPPEPARTDFRETAYFSPQLNFQKGTALVDFTFPDSLTRWAVGAFAIDSSIRYATLRTQVVTRKEFSVSLTGPRFLREEDKVSLASVATNHSSNPLSGKATLLVELQNGKKHFLETKAFRVLPGQTTPLVFSFTVPSGQLLLKATVTSSAGNYQDAEVQTFSVLPNRFRSVASKVVALVPGKETEVEIQVPEGAKAESVTLQVDPELASVLFQAVPLLAKQTQKDSPSVADRLVSLGLLESLLVKYPSFAKVRRTTKTAAWAKKDPRSTIPIEETPWLSESEGSGDAVSLSPSEAKALVKTLTSELESLQTARGGFPWFSGGKEDFRLSLNVLSRLAEAKRSGVILSTAIVEKAAPYLKQEIAKEFTPKEESLANRLLVAHIVSVLYPTEEWKTFISETLRLAQKHSDDLTPYAKGLVSDVAFRSGDSALGEAFLEKALDGGKENAWGFSWASEKVSWHWYNDSIDKHAFFLRLLLDWKPQDPRVYGLAKWLVLNRKTSLWKSTRNSASAVISLLEYQKARGVIQAPQAFTYAWAGQKAFVPASTSALRWTKKPATVASLKATVSQKGEGIGFASLTAPYASAQGMRSGSGLLSLRANYFSKSTAADGRILLTELKSGAEVLVGTEVEVVYTVNAEAPLGYLGIRAPRAAGFEPADKQSQWLSGPVLYYRELRDSVDSFFLPEVPQGEILLRNRFFAEQPGRYHFGPVTGQSVYAPDISAADRGFSLGVVPKR